MPKDLSYVETADSEEALFTLLVKKPVDLILFFETAGDDETWSDVHEVFMRRALDWLTLQTYHDKLDKPYAVRIAKTVWKHHHVLKPYVQDNLVIKLKDAEVPFNGLLLSAASDNFKQIIIKECRDKNGHTLTFSQIDRSAFLPIESFINTGEVPQLPTMGQEELIALIRRAQAWGLDELSKQCEQMLGKYLTHENILPMLNQAKREQWFYFAGRCADFFNQHNWGFRIETVSLDRLAFEFFDFQEEALRYFAHLKSLITDIICQGELNENSHFGPILKQCPGLISLDISRSPEFNRQLLDIPRSLQALTIMECAWTSRDTFKQLLGICPELKQINLSNNVHLNFSAWGELAKFKQLKNLSLDLCHQIPDADLGIILKGCGNLTTLSLSKCIKIGEKGFLELAKSLPRLTHLNLHRCSVTDNALVEIASRCRNLSVLDISACGELTEKGMVAFVRNAASLQELNLNRCRITSTAIDEIKRLSPLLNIIL